MADKYAQVDLYIGSIVVHHAGMKVSDEDAKKFGWEELVSTKKPENTEHEFGQITGQNATSPHGTHGEAVVPKIDGNKKSQDGASADDK